MDYRQFNDMAQTRIDIHSIQTFKAIPAKLFGDAHTLKISFRNGECKELYYNSPALYGTATEEDHKAFEKYKEFFKSEAKNLDHALKVSAMDDASRLK